MAGKTKTMFIGRLLELVDKRNNTTHRIIMQKTSQKTSKYIDFHNVSNIGKSKFKIKREPIRIITSYCRKNF